MSSEINKCGDCGCTFLGETPKHHFSCSECGFEYVELDGLWYDSDRADEIQDIKNFRMEILAERISDICDVFYEKIPR